MKPKHIFWAFGILAVVLILYFALRKKTPAVASGPAILGKSSSGKDYTETDVQNEIKIIQGDAGWLKSIQDKAATDGVKMYDALRANAIYMIENAPGH